MLNVRGQQDKSALVARREYFCIHQVGEEQQSPSVAKSFDLLCMELWDGLSGLHNTINWSSTPLCLTCRRLQTWSMNLLLANDPLK